MKFVLILFTIFMSARLGLCIRCYECNSMNNSMCLDLKSYDDETLNKFVKVSECQQGVYSPDTHEFFCRKIVQTIFHKHRDSEVRVTRGCGWIRHKKECYKADNEDHLETVCQCFNDGCNAASLAQLSSLAFALTAVVGLTKFI